MNKFLFSVMVAVLSLSIYGCSSTDSQIGGLRSTSKNIREVSDITYSNYYEENDETILLNSFGKEVSYDVLLTIDRKKEFGKNYMLIYPSDSMDEDIELEAYCYIENEEHTGGNLIQIKTDDEWDMIEEVFNKFMDKTW